MLSAAEHSNLHKGLYCRGVWADHPLELSPDDALVEDGRLPRRWQHSRHQASSGITLSPDDALLEDGRLPRRWQHSRHQASPGITLNNQDWRSEQRTLRALSFIGGVHIGARALHVRNLI
jgi:hypothetical protein